MNALESVRSGYVVVGVDTHEMPVIADYDTLMDDDL